MLELLPGADRARAKRIIAACNARVHDDINVAMRPPAELIAMIRDGQQQMGERAQSDRMIERLEVAAGISVRAPGFPETLVDEEPPARGAEVVVRR